MKTYPTEHRIFYVFAVFAFLSLLLAILPPITTNSFMGATIFAFVFLFFGIIGTKFSYSTIENGSFSVRFLFFSKRSVNVKDISSIRYAPTWKFQRSLKSLYIDYEGRKWWPIELKNSMYAEAILAQVMRDLKRANPAIELDKEARELLIRHGGAL